MPRRALTLVAFGFVIGWSPLRSVGAQSATATGGPTLRTVRRAAGCYELTVGVWSGSLSANGPQGAQRPPAWFALDSAHLTPPRNSLYAVQPTTIGPRRNRPASWPRMPAFWQPVGTDSAAITWSNGFIGVTLRVAIREDSLIGHAQVFQDAHRPGEPPAPEAPVVAVRMPCPPDSGASAGSRTAPKQGQVHSATIKRSRSATLMYRRS